jgi:small subunit ribosomal protein S21e
MINDAGEVVDLYVPRKCSWTNKLITAKDHAAVQINVGHLNADGVYTGQFTTLALAGNVRGWGTADTAVDLLWKKAQAARPE